MTKLVILSQHERRRFDSPPMFNTNERALYFSLNNEDLHVVQGLRTATNKVGFVLQLGYFRSQGKFFTAEQFRNQDIEHIGKMLNIDPNTINLSSYQKKIPSDHRKLILSLMKWQPFDNTQQEKIADHVHWLAQRQFSPRHVFLSIVDFCGQNKVELATYNALALIITNSYNKYEHELIDILASKLTPHHQEKLDTMVGANNSSKKKHLQRPPITLIKQINQSLKPLDIKTNVQAFKLFQEYFCEFNSLINELKLSDQATEYFATWVQKSTVYQLNQFPNRNKLYLHLLCYIKYQFYFRHDVLIDIFLKSVKSAINAANKKLNLIEKETRVERNKAIKKIAAANKNSRELICKITDAIKSPALTLSAKLSKIEELVDAYNVANNEIEK